MKANEWRKSVHTISTWWMWLAFFIFVLTMLALDMVVFGGKKSHKVTTREALTWTAIWVSCALVFNVLFWWYLKTYHSLAIANQKALEFFTGYLIEESLSVDNMFVFLMIFNYFAVPPAYQRRVLLYGVIGAIVMRLLMILMGTWLVNELHWILYVFGFFILVTGIKMIFVAENQKELGDNFIIKGMRRYLRVTDTFHDEHFFVKQNLLWYVTPLFLVLVSIEISDLIFALDSIPAIFAITNDPFIIFTSNIFAIMGLRALYFLLANMALRFYLLKYGIALILIFIGVKMLIAPWVVIPILVALSIVVTILATTVILSLFIKPPRSERKLHDRK